MILMLLYGIGLVISCVIIIGLIVRRIRIKKTENFEKRDD